jgi:hypothetical protein
VQEGVETRTRRTRADLWVTGHGAVSHGGTDDRFGGNPMTRGYVARERLAGGGMRA